MIKPGDLVKHADWDQSPLNSYREEVGFVVSYDLKKWHATEESQKRWVVVQWLPHRDRTCTTIYSVDSLRKVEECR